MEGVIAAIGKTQDQYVALTKLEDFQRKGTDVAPILFNTCPTARFSEIVEEIKESYTEELKIKKCTAENVAHCEQREEINFCSIAWIHQNSVTPSTKSKLESFFIETDNC